MRRNFHLDWDMPSSHLCPGLPGRINYLNWIHEVLCLHEKYAHADSSPLLGIDVGTGASCIYPLLGNALYHWKFVATDIDEESIASSKRLVEKNHLESEITVKQRTPSQPLLKDVVDFASNEVAFCVCNPPFFSNEAEVM